MTAPIPVTDLTQRPPRGFRVRIGGLVILAGMLDKGRATLAGKNGEYEYLTSTDEHLVRFLGFDPDALLKELATGKGASRHQACFQERFSSYPLPIISRRYAEVRDEGPSQA